ncbi:unnamed protein product [Calypogeia fissa]
MPARGGDQTQTTEEEKRPSERFDARQGQAATGRDSGIGRVSAEAGLDWAGSRLWAARGAGQGEAVGVYGTSKEGRNERKTPDESGRMLWLEQTSRERTKQRTNHKTSNKTNEQRGTFKRAEEARHSFRLPPSRWGDDAR